MIANRATHPALFLVHSKSQSAADDARHATARARGQSRGAANQPGAAGAPAHRWLPWLAETRGSGPRGPHPGDILYWVACLGGVCLLLLSAT